MSARGETRQRAYEIACELAREKRRPTITAIRDALGGKGGQQAIMQGLNDWIEEAAGRFRMDDVPDALNALIVGVWRQSIELADARWEETRDGLKGAIEELEARANELESALSAATKEAMESGRLIKKHEATIVALTEENTGLESVLGNAESERARLSGELDTQCAARSHAERLAAEARTSLAEAQERMAAMGSALDVIRAEKVMTEDALAAAKAHLSEARADIDAMRGMVNETQVSLSVRDKEIASLHDLLRERDRQADALTQSVADEQAARESDTQRWIGVVEEERAARRDAAKRERDAAKREKDLREQLARAETRIERLLAEAAVKKEKTETTEG